MVGRPTRGLINGKVLLSLFRQPNIYRLITASIMVLVSILALVEPTRLTEPDDWAYYYAAKNFSQGRLVIDEQLHNQQVAEARARGGELIQYVRIGTNRWALEKAPGTVFYMVPFDMLGIPKAANIVLAFGIAFIIYLVLKRLRDEKTACIGTLLLLVTPVTLTMLFRAYMDTFSGSAFLFIGGGLYIYYMMRQTELKPFIKGAALFLAFFFISWSVVARYTNFPIALVFALHYCITRIALIAKKRTSYLTPEIAPVVIGIGIPMAILLGYHTIVFGSPFNYGYNYTKLPIKFAFQYFGQTDTQGNSIPLQIIAGNLRNMPPSLFIGFPLLVIAIPATFVILYQKATATFTETKVDTWAELRWNILFLLIGWAVCVFPLYMLYEWTAPSQMESMPFIVKARFYLPGLFPIVIFTSLLITRLARELVIVLLAVSLVMGPIVSVQSAIVGLGRPSEGKPPIQEPLEPEFQKLLPQQQLTFGQVVPPGNLREAARNADQAYR